MNPYAYSVLAFGFCALLIGFFVWLRLGNKLGFSYFVFSIFAGLWGMIFGVFLVNDTKYEIALLGARLSNLSACCMAPAWYGFTLNFSEKRINKQNIFVLILLCCFSLYVLLNVFSNSFVPKMQAAVGFKYYTFPGKLYVLYTVHFFLGIGLGFLNLFAALKKSIGEHKKKIQRLIFSTGLGFIGGSLTFLPVYGVEFPQVGMLVLPLYPILMAIAIMRFDLFNVKDIAMAAHKDKLAALGILTASINHEIRGPLFAMRGVVETRSDNEDLKNKLLSQIDRLTGIVSRLTHFAKKGVDEQAKIEPLNLNEVLTDVRTLIQYQLNYQGIEYIQEIPANLPKLLADRRYLEEILFNLIINACQALKDRKDGRIKVSAQAQNNKVEICIEDNGPGISPEQLKNIFKPFHTTKAEGTGLGLYITKQLAEKCGAILEASQRSSRTTFKIGFAAA